MSFLGMMILAFVLCVICDLMKSRKPAIIAGSILMAIGFGMILGESMKGWYYLCAGVGVIIMVGRESGYSLRKESRKCAPVLYVASIILMIMGMAFWEKLFPAGMILLIGTAGIRFLDCITSPIKIHIKKHDE